MLHRRQIHVFRGNLATLLILPVADQDMGSGNLRKPMAPMAGRPMVRRLYNIIVMIETVRNGVKTLRGRITRHKDVVKTGFTGTAVVKDDAGRVQFIGISGGGGRVCQNLYNVRGSRQKMQLWKQRVNLLQKGVCAIPSARRGDDWQQASYAFP